MAGIRRTDPILHGTPRTPQSLGHVVFAAYLPAILYGTLARELGAEALEMNIATANNKIFMLYAPCEEATVRRLRKQLKDEGIIAIPCEDPKNFRFVTPEVMVTSPETMDIIGRLALKHVGTYQASDFLKDLRAALAPEAERAS